MAMRQSMIAASLVACVTLGGCAGLYDCCYEKTQSARAIKQYMQCGKPECSDYPHDYKCGWIDGFYEVSTGGSLCPPAIAPARYWKPGQILKDCDNRRHEYYSGWQDGAARASMFPDTHTIRIHETCECPFPRCENPCGDACVPCGMPTVGMPMSVNLIESSMPHGAAMPLPIVPADQDGDDEEVPPAPAVDGEGVQAPTADDNVKSGSAGRTLSFVPSRPIGQAISYQSVPAPIQPAGIPATDSRDGSAGGVIRLREPASRGVALRGPALTGPTLHQPAKVDSGAAISEMIESDSIIRLVE